MPTVAQSRNKEVRNMCNLEDQLNDVCMNLDKEHSTDLSVSISVVRGEIYLYNHGVFMVSFLVNEYDTFETFRDLIEGLILDGLFD